MSLQSWKEEFYPEDAADVAARGDERECIAHSLRKWEGLKAENLGWHGVKFHMWGLEDEGWCVLPIESSTCALCLLHDNESGALDPDYCGRCALYLVRGYTACDGARHDEATSPWHLRTYEPERMIWWLQRAIEYVEGKVEPFEDKED